jgi:hypothetical protein
MKDFKKGLSFGMSVVNAGQRAVSEEPELIVTSTSGGFRVSSSVSRAMGVGHGEYIMFIKNVDEVQEAINAQAEPFVQFCEEAGLDPLSAEAAAAFHKEYDMWAIAKGNPCYDKHGNPLTVKERMTTKDKKTILENRYAEILEAALASGNEEVVAALSVEGMSDDDKKEVLMQFMTGETTQKFNGSKCANSSGMKGAGTILNFTDSNVWMRLKADLGENAEKVNRKYSVDVENTIPVQVDNGKEVITVKAFVLGEYKDEEPARNKKAE